MFALFLRSSQTGAGSVSESGDGVGWISVPPCICSRAVQWCVALLGTSVLPLGNSCLCNKVTSGRIGSLAFRVISA